MRQYETIAVLRPDQADAQVGAFLKKVEKILAGKPGAVLKKDDWGLRRLAYEIGKQRKGRYLYWLYRQEPGAVRALDRLLRVDEHVLRFLTVVAEERKPGEAAAAGKAAGASEAAAAHGEGRREEPPRRRGLHFFADRTRVVDYKDVGTLSNFITERGKIAPRRASGMNAFQQRALAKAIKRARQIALLSYNEGYVAHHEEVGP